MMGRFFWVLLFIFATQSSVNAQVIKGFGAMGLNMTQVDGDEAFGYKMPGLNVSIGAMIPFRTNWDVSIETSFSQKGANQRAQYKLDTLNGAYKLRLNYVEIPVLIHYTDKNFISLGSGFSFARLVGASEFEHGKQTNTNAANGVYSKNDLNVIIDINLRMVEKLKFNFRYQYSMKSIRTREFSNVGGSRTWLREQYNNMLSFRLVYIFNEEQSKRVSKENTQKN